MNSRTRRSVSSNASSAVVAAPLRHRPRGFSTLCNARPARNAYPGPRPVRREPVSDTPPPAAVDDGPVKRPLFAMPASPGLWLGIGGMVMFLVAAFLPWYTISAKFPSAGFNDWTVIIQFDGLNGLFVHGDLKTRLGLGVPAVGFPLIILFVVSFFFKIRKLVRSTSHKARSASLFRGSINILIPVILTIIVISQFALFIPGDAPPEIKDLGQAIAGQPFGGERNFTLTDDVGLQHQGSLRWGFGPALWVMIAAAALMNLGSQLEKRIARKALKELRAPPMSE